MSAVAPGSRRATAAALARLAGAPGDDAALGQREGLVRGVDQALRPAPQLGHQHAARRGAERPLLGVRGARREQVAQPLEPADHVVADHDRAVVLDRGELRAVLQALEQRLRAAVDEALGQPVVQRVAQRVLDRAGALLPMRRIAQPVGVVGDVGPGPDVGEPRDQRVDVARGPLEARDLIGDPVGRQPAVVGEMAEHRVEQLQMGLGQRLAEIRDLAHRPQQPHAGGRRARARAPPAGAPAP